jgi:hypothetical protein
MNGQHVITDTAHKLKPRIRLLTGAEEGYNTFLAGIRYSLHMKSVQQVEQELIAYEDGFRSVSFLRTRNFRAHGAALRSDTSETFFDRSAAALHLCFCLERSQKPLSNA